MIPICVVKGNNKHVIAISFPRHTVHDGAPGERTGQAALGKCSAL